MYVKTICLLMLTGAGALYSCGGGCTKIHHYIIDRTGYWKTLATSSEREYEYKDPMPRDNARHLRIMTLNFQRVNPATRRWYHIWSGGEPWFQADRLRRIQHVIQHFKPDVIGLQEIWSGMALGLIDVFPEPYKLAETAGFPYTQTLKEPIIYNTDRCTLETLDTPAISDDQNVTHAIFTDDMTDSSFSVFNTHIGGDLYKRLNDITQDVRSEQQPCYITADFNQYIPYVADDINGIESADTSNIPTYVPRDTTKSPGSGYRIDGILYYTAVSAVVQSNVVRFDDEVTEDGIMQQDNRMSDHRPVIADFDTNTLKITSSNNETE